MKTIVFPEGQNIFIQSAAEQLKTFCTPILLNNNLNQAAQLLADKKADAMLAGIDCSSRDVILAARDIIGLRDGQETFSSLFVAALPDGRRLILSDAATCKNPSAKQLADIVILVHEAAQKLLAQPPKIAMLSFSTFDSGGKDPSIDKIKQSIQLVSQLDPQIKIDGEMQLDAAVNPRIGAKKAPHSEVAGQANILITPDINSGNILYKAIEQFAAATLAGPILLGFNRPISDLSRGSSVEDIVFSAKTLLALSDR